MGPRRPSQGSRRTALHKSAYWGHVDIVKYLITLGVRMDAKDVNGDTAMHDAAKFGHAAVVEALVGAGASTTIKNNDGHDVLAIAAEYRKFDCVRAIGKSQQSKL